MITLDVFIQNLNQRWDVRIDENLTAYQAAEEIVGLAAQQAQLIVPEEHEGFILADNRKKRVLAPAKTLLENGVEMGDSFTLL